MIEQMETRKNEMLAFLKFMANEAANNYLNANFVYEKLTQFGFSEETLIEQNFEYWIREFENQRNLNVFVNPGWSYFCQFVNINRNNERYNHLRKFIGDNVSTNEITYKQMYEDPIKLYVSLDKEHIKEGVKIIFKFLQENNIIHLSKVGKVIRRDSVVLRIYNKEDALKVIDFINSNKYLIEGHNNCIPFCMRKGIVGIAQDNYNSYNEVTSHIIKEYINYKKSINDLKKITLEDFIEFVKKINVGTKEFQQELSTYNSELYKYNIPYTEEIKQLLLINLVSNNLNDYFAHFDNSIKNKKIKQEEKNMTIDILKIAVKATTQKHNIVQARNAIIAYLSCGFVMGFSRTTEDGKEARNKIKNINYKVALTELQKYTKLDNIADCVNYLLKEVYIKENENVQKIYRAYLCMIDKYGYERALYALKMFLEQGETNFFTRESIEGKPVRSTIIGIDYKKEKETLEQLLGKENMVEKLVAYLDYSSKDKKNIKR